MRAATPDEILRLLLPFRRATDLASNHSPAAFGPQLDQLRELMAEDRPILFTLPAFPCKSPNAAKVLGHLPDEGERLALRFLDELCQRVARTYPAGARMLICSDGHIFGDFIGVPDPTIDAYAAELTAMIERERLSRVTTFNLGDVLGDMSYEDKRRHVERRYGPTVEELRAQTKTDPELMRLYLGITRFLVEDTANFTGTKSALQRDCRRRAYGVIQRSRAWGALIAERYPVSVRLSIHPQPAGSHKFGIRLLPADNVWITPWHSCLVRAADGRIELMPHAAAERLGRVVVRDGRPSHIQRVQSPAPALVGATRA